MANQNNPGGRPSMDEEKRQGGSKEQRDQNKPERQNQEINPDKNQNPGQPGGAGGRKS